MSHRPAPVALSANLLQPHFSTPRRALTLNNIVQSFFTWREDMLANLGAKGLLVAIRPLEAPAGPPKHNALWLFLSRKASRDRDKSIQAQMDVVLAREAAIDKVVQTILFEVGWDLRQQYASYFSLPCFDRARRIWELLHAIWLHEYVTDDPHRDQAEHDVTRSDTQNG